MNVECSRGLDRSWDASSVSFSHHISYSFKKIIICLFEGTSLPIIPVEGEQGIVQR